MINLDQIRTKQEPAHQETSLLWLQFAPVTSPQVVHTFVSSQWAQETNVWGIVLAGVRRRRPLKQSRSDMMQRQQSLGPLTGLPRHN